MSNTKRCPVCGNPSSPGFDLCGPCLTGEADTADDVLVLSGPWKPTGRPMTDVQVINWLMSNRAVIESRICDALASAIRAHGAVTMETRNSAAKRVVGELKGIVKALRKGERPGKRKKD